MQPVFDATAARHRPPGSARIGSRGLVAGLGLAVLIGLSSSGCADDPEQRRGSIYDWKADPTPENVENIRGLLDDPDRDVRATALNVLVSLSVADSDTLALTGLRDPDGFVRATASKLLGDLGDSNSAEVLVDRVNADKDPIVRRRAAEALTKIGGEIALAGLAGATSDPVDAVRLAAAKGLRKTDPCYAKSALVRLLVADSLWEVQVQAATALGACGDPDVLPALEQALEDPNEFVRSAAANAIRSHEAAPDPVEGDDE